MQKTYNVKPIPMININFSDGYSIKMRFDTIATYHLTTEFDFDDLLENPSITETCARIVYSASVENTKDMTIEKARELVCEMDCETILGIVKDFEDSCGVEVDKDFQKKTMREFINKQLMKHHK